MKKSFKPIILLVVLIMSLSTLTGCQKLDDMRSTHAVWTEKGAKDSITFNGVEYKRIYAENIPSVYDVKYEVICVTEPDVPVLLASSMCDTFDITKDKNFIVGYISHETYDEVSVSDAVTDSFLDKFYGQGGEYCIFCKADIYEDVMKEIEDGIEYTDYNYHYVTEDGELCYYFLTDEEKDAVNKVLKEVEPEQNTDYVSSYYTSVYLSSVNENYCFCADYNYEILWDEVNNKYTIVTYPLVEDYGMAYEDYGMSYEVPDEMTDIFDEITKIAKETNKNYARG